MFLGRQHELSELFKFGVGPGGAVSLVGMGGAGKTAILSQFVHRVLEERCFDGVLVWSFYDDPDTNAFLRAAVEYVLGHKTEDANGAGWFHALKQAIDGGGRFLFILDGLERVQRAVTDAQGIYGELEDALLRGFLVRIASGFGNSLAVITSRFPISDLDRWKHRGYSSIEVDHLDSETALHVLNQHGVSGDHETLDHLNRTFGRHALTIDLLGSAIVRFFNSDPNRAIEAAGALGTDEVARLACVLEFFHERLCPAELELMSRLCVFRFGVSPESLVQVFSNTETSIPLKGHELEALVASLVATHLVHVELNGKLTVHPAVRDHFYRLFRDAATVHGAISDHLLNLSERPGIGMPTAKESLDLLEELIYHAIRADHVTEAAEIFRYRMGGNDHLNVVLGEYARTFRILSAFPQCPDSGAMYHSLRAFGEFEEALRWRPQNKYIRIANGRLEELSDDPSEATRKVVKFLTGGTIQAPERMADFPLSAAHLHLMANAIDDAEQAALSEIQVAMYQDDLTRAELALAEVARRRNRREEACERLNRAGTWVLRSGSHEHLFFLFLYRARLEIDQGEFRLAKSTLEEALNLVLESNFKLFGVEAHCEMARLHMATLNFEAALSEAEIARKEAGRIQFAWGEIASLHLLADAAAHHGDRRASLDALRSLLSLQRTVGDPQSHRTELALRRLEG